MHCGTQHTPYPAKGPVLPRGPGRSPERKFWPIQRIFQDKKTARKVRVKSEPAMAPEVVVASFAGPWGACRGPRGP